MPLALHRPSFAALAALALAATPAAAAPALRFATANYATGGLGGPGYHETSSAVADFNGDGYVDLVVADLFDPLGTGPLLLLNRGDGTFTSPGRRVTITPVIGTLLAGDVNRDGKADLVVTSQAAVSVRLGNGDGSFRAGPTYLLPQGFQNDAVLGDFDRDGVLDVIVKTFAGVQSLLGNGDGSFRAGPFSLVIGSVTPALSGISLAHFDRDGIPDLAAADAATQRVFALKGAGDGSFTVTGSGVVLLVPGTMLAGDFDGDGIDDAVALQELSVPGTSMAFLRGTGTGGFAPATYHDGGFIPATGELGDVNGDGHLDVISCDTVGSQLAIQLGDGRGGFTLGGKFPVSIFPQTPVAADFNRDGRLDLATAGAGSGPILGPTFATVLRNLGPSS